MASCSRLKVLYSIFDKSMIFHNVDPNLEDLGEYYSIEAGADVVNMRLLTKANLVVDRVTITGDNEDLSLLIGYAGANNAPEDAHALLRFYKMLGVALSTGFVSQLPIHLSQNIEYNLRSGFRSDVHQMPLLDVLTKKHGEFLLKGWPLDLFHEFFALSEHLQGDVDVQLFLLRLTHNLEIEYYWSSPLRTRKIAVSGFKELLHKLSDPRVSSEVYVSPKLRKRLFFPPDKGELKDVVDRHALRGAMKFIEFLFDFNDLLVRAEPHPAAQYAMRDYYHYLLVQRAAQVSDLINAALLAGTEYYAADAATRKSLSTRYAEKFELEGIRYEWNEVRQHIAHKLKYVLMDNPSRDFEFSRELVPA
jgi:hypothetical protein